MTDDPNAISGRDIAWLAHILRGEPIAPIATTSTLAASSATAMYAANGNGRLDALRGVAPPWLVDLTQVRAMETEPQAGPSEFPYWVLPRLAREFVEQAAQAGDTAPAFVALPVLAISAALIGNRVCLVRKEGMVLYPVLWLVSVGRPGTGKTPGLEYAEAPLKPLMRLAQDEYDAAMTAYQAALIAWRSTPQRARGPEPVKPQLERFTVMDTTLEALVGHLERSRGLVMLQDEATQWVNSFDAYRGGKGGDRQHWLSFWSSRDLSVDRVGHATFVKSPVVPVVGGAQPDLLPTLAEAAGRSDGFLERILWSYPQHHVPRDTDEQVEPLLNESMSDLYRRLRYGGGEQQRRVRLDADALRSYRAWTLDNAARTEAADGVLTGTYAKLPLQALRLALVLHCLDHPEEPDLTLVDAGTLLAALDLVEYFRGQAYAVVKHIGEHKGSKSAGIEPGETPVPDADDVLAEKFLRALARGPAEGIDARALYRLVRTNAAEIKAAQAILLARERIVLTPIPTGPSGGRPSFRWQLTEHAAAGI